MKDIHFRIFLGVIAVTLMVVLAMTIIASNQMSRDLDQLLLDVQEIEAMSLQLEAETETILEGLDEIHPDE